MSGRAELLERLDAVEARLAARSTAAYGSESLTDAEPGSGKRWHAGQVWAHVAEAVPYWIDQAQLVANTYVDEPVPFGRTKSDLGRIAAIARDRDQPVSVLWAVTHSDIEALRLVIASLDDVAWSARGLHPTRGVMSMEQIFDEFLVAHLEEHADQLETLS
ncbi:MAG TPA: hypothetical protein VF155_03680 [Candidatus Dormibacteraeota bacterium]